MTSLLYESSTRTQVNLIQDHELSYAQLVSDSPYSNNCPVVDRDDVALHQNVVYVLDSTKSGPELRTIDTSVYGRIIRPLFEDVFKVKHTYVATTSSTSIEEFSSTLESTGKPILMIIIAGDTSVGEFVNSLSKKSSGKIKVFVVPAGTGNSLALSLGITDEAKAIQRLFLHTDENVSPFHLYEAKFPEGSFLLQNTGRQKPLLGPVLFVVVASWAFHASLVADSDTEEMRKHGINRFKVAAHENLTRRQEYNGILTIEGEKNKKIVHKGPFAYLVITPSQKFEPTFTISPKGDIFNSDLYVIGFQTENDESYILEIMKEVYNEGAHTKDERVFYDQVDNQSTIAVTLGRNQSLETRRFCIDGAVVVVPDNEENILRVGYHGSKVAGWDISIVN
ncbi:hypothetical protein JCM33374_g4248 [Metschnikowia sp. JCM 33374]|nr:hypothetical protein JCM33374_g4248 [Metschnikowia sp. JCM 33374]